MSPFPNEHACRIHNPGGYQEDSFRRKKSGKLSLILAKKPGKDTMEVQSFRYPISDWDEDAAREHCKEQGGTFEPASKEEKMVEISAEELIELAERNPELSDYKLVEKALGEVKEQEVDMKFCTLVGEDGMVSLVLGQKSWELGKV